MVNCHSTALKRLHRLKIMGTAIFSYNFLIKRLVIALDDTICQIPVFCALISHQTNLHKKIHSFTIEIRKIIISSYMLILTSLCRQFEVIYNDMHEEDLKSVVERTGCLAPCSYTEYRIKASIELVSIFFCIAAKQNLN